MEDNKEEQSISYRDATHEEEEKAPANNKHYV